MSRFSGWNVVVTGAGRGIGFATAELFSAEGARVTIVDIDPALAEAAAAKLNAAHAVLDVSHGDQVEAFFAGLTSLDTLICNAGRLYSTTTLAASEEDWNASHDVNAKSAWLCARAAHPLLSKSAHASIVTVASAQGLRSSRRSFPYSASKGSLIALTRSLAVEYAPAIRVNGILPGQIESVRTEPYFASFKNPEEARRRVLSTFPMRRLGKPEDIAQAIAFLASPAASWITGTLLTVDGGRDAALLDLSDLEP
ncbi:MAG: SDR family oxidoreductase [Bryobacteraceae bacterium]|nr:SDR family oxidoreductase [Bryobacteraceae bacterium]